MDTQFDQIRFSWNYSQRILAGEDQSFVLFSCTNENWNSTCILCDGSAKTATVVHSEVVDVILILSIVQKENIRKKGMWKLSVFHFKKYSFLFFFAMSLNDRNFGGVLS